MPDAELPPPVPESTGPLSEAADSLEDDAELYPFYRAIDPVLDTLWDNEMDAIYDDLPEVTTSLPPSHLSRRVQGT